MKNILPLFVLMTAVLGCDISRFVNSGGDNSKSAKPTPTVDAKPSPTGTPTVVPTRAGSGFIDVLKKAKGKYPYQVKLLDIPDLNARLKKLLGSNFAAMKKYWNVETPIEIENDILMTSGCEAHNCSSNHYLLFIDLKSDDINVYHLEDGETKHYYERGEIKLPSKFADELGSDS